MFFQKFERNLLDGELWSIWQKTKLPDHLQSLVDKEQNKRNDIWELPSEKQVQNVSYSSHDQKSHSKNI